MSICVILEFTADFNDTWHLKEGIPLGLSGVFNFGLVAVISHIYLLFYNFVRKWLIVQKVLVYIINVDILKFDAFYA
jgi:hypothetical protein